MNVFSDNPNIHLIFLERNRQIVSFFKTPHRTVQLLLYKVVIPPSDFFSAEWSEPGFSNALIQDCKT